MLKLICRETHSINSPVCTATQHTFRRRDVSILQYEWARKINTKVWRRAEMNKYLSDGMCFNSVDQFTCTHSGQMLFVRLDRIYFGSSLHLHLPRHGQSNPIQFNWIIVAMCAKQFISRRLLLNHKIVVTPILLRQLSETVSNPVQQQPRPVLISWAVSPSATHMKTQIKQVKLIRELSHAAIFICGRLLP